MRLGSASAQAFAGLLDERGQALEVERLAHAVLDDVQRRVFGLRRLLLLFLRAFLRALFAIQHVGARDFVLAAAHQRELDLVLDFLDVDRAAIGLALHQRGDDGVGEPRHLVAHARASRALAAVDGEERLGHARS